MATLLPNVRQQFLDLNGLPLAGGKLYSYAAGTTTPQATYTDQSESTPNANPTILDASGMASVWIANFSYKLQLQDSLGNILWTVDNVASIFDLSVTTQKIANQGVTTQKIAAGALSSDSTGRAIMAAQYIQTIHVGDKQITAAKIADNTITPSQLAVGIGLIPTGGVVDFPGITLPTGYLWCDGASYLRTAYPALFAAIGTAHGAADSTHFNVPDRRGRFVRGANTAPGGSPSGNDPDIIARVAQATGGNTGDNVGSIQPDAIGAHSHGINLKDVSGNGNVSTGTNGVTSSGNTATQTAGGFETRPKNQYTNFIIKT